MKQQLTKIKNLSLKGANERPFLLDCVYAPTGRDKPIVVFVHGYKGFKDWGIWDLVAEAFAKAGFIFVKFNFSHNGTGLEAPKEFTDLEAFGQNNYTKEKADLEAVLGWLHQQEGVFPSEEAALSRVGLIGHSRGGGLSLVFAAGDSRIKAVSTWAAVSRLDYAWYPELIQNWKQTGVYHITNGRTGQQMPMYYQMYEDFLANRRDFDTAEALKKLDKPLLIVHGTADPAVPLSAAHDLQSLYPDAELYVIPGADHVFGGSHPYKKEELPMHAKELVDTTIKFFRASL